MYDKYRQNGTQRMGCVGYVTAYCFYHDLRGLGVFAGSKKIYQGTFVGIYAGELLTDQVGEQRGLLVIDYLLLFINC
jgi:hypothetical protein